MCIHQKWRNCLINRWLISISKSVIKLWDDWGMIGIQQETLSAHIHHWTASFPPFPSSFFLFSSSFFISKSNIILMAHSPGSFTQIDSIYGCAPVEKHTQERFNLLVLLQLTVLIYNTHTPPTHTPLWDFILALFLSLSLSLSHSPSSVSLSNQSNPAGTAD